MTVKDAIRVLKDAKDINLACGASLVPFDHKDALQVEAYGNYVVDEIRADKEESYEIGIMMRPVKVVAE